MGGVGEWHPLEYRALESESWEMLQACSPQGHKLALRGSTAKVNIQVEVSLPWDSQEMQHRAISDDRTFPFFP